MKLETEDANFKLVKARNESKDLKIEIKELREVLNSQENFKLLESTVVELSAIMVSKRAESLSSNQKEQLKALFGHSAVLQRLRHKLLEAEDAARKS